MSPHKEKTHIEDMDTATIEEELQRRKAKKGNGNGWKKWTSIGGITSIATVILAWPIIQPILASIADIPVRSTPVILAHQGEIDTLQKNQAEQHDTLIVLTNQVETIREMVVEIRDHERRNNAMTPKQKDQNP